MDDALDHQIKSLAKRGLTQEKIAESLAVPIERVLALVPRPETAAVLSGEKIGDAELGLKILREIANNPRVNPNARITAATTLIDEDKGRRGAAAAAGAAIGAAALQEALSALNGIQRKKAFSVFDKQKEIPV